MDDILADYNEKELKIMLKSLVASHPDIVGTLLWPQHPLTRQIERSSSNRGY